MGFPSDVLLRLGFHPKFIELIMLCVTMVIYSFMLISEQFGFVRPSQGIRQRNLLSPYLFSFCAEAFSNMVNQAERRGELQDVAVAQHTSRISHLLFADDTLIFRQASEEALGCIKRILKQLEQASGLKINLDKFAMVYSRNVPQAGVRPLLLFLVSRWWRNTQST
ncbi:UNVERIFIED_CONTAM: hypothetical protein Slati_2985700 [Sesamum latifolium]|uniref:Reverse transcriptase domain-containing protein n=1 Tax=Sesamum latifolium TaxID=2727402 RepID=A0AAW2VED8_9LAMI